MAFLRIDMKIDLNDVEYVTETSITIRGTRRRTTVPKEIAAHFGLKDGDRFRWILFKDDNQILTPKATLTKG